MHINNNGSSKLIKPTKKNMPKMNFGHGATSSSSKKTCTPLAEEPRTPTPNNLPLKNKALTGLKAGGMAGLVIVAILAPGFLPITVLLGSGLVVAGLVLGAALLGPASVARNLDQYFLKKTDSSQSP